MRGQISLALPGFSVEVTKWREGKLWNFEAGTNFSRILGSLLAELLDFRSLGEHLIHRVMKTIKPLCAPIVEFNAGQNGGVCAEQAGCLQVRKGKSGPSESGGTCNILFCFSSAVCHRRVFHLSCLSPCCEGRGARSASVSDRVRLSTYSCLPHRVLPVGF